MSVNARLDRLARVDVTLAGRSRPAFRFCALAGFAIAVVAGAALTAGAGRSLAVTGVLAVICAVTFVVHTVGRTVLTGQERLVYYHHEIACIAACALVLRLLGEPVLAYLDIAIIGIGICLVAGRVGCFAVGCCHGRPWRLGVRYREEHVANGLAPHWLGVRLFPLQLLEAGLAAAIVAAAAGTVLAGSTPGTAVALYAVAYGAVRFLLELARGDAGRGSLAGLTQPQWLSLSSGLLVLALGERGTLPAGAPHVVLTAAVTVAAAAIALRSLDSGPRAVEAESTSSRP